MCICVLKSKSDFCFVFFLSKCQDFACMQIRNTFSFRNVCVVCNAWYGFPDSLFGRFRDVDGRTLLDIFDEKLHPLSVRHTPSHLQHAHRYSSRRTWAIMLVGFVVSVCCRSRRSQPITINMIRSRSRSTASSGRSSAPLSWRPSAPSSHWWGSGHETCSGQGPWYRKPEM